MKHRNAITLEMPTAVELVGKDQQQQQQQKKTFDLRFENCESRVDMI